MTVISSNQRKIFEEQVLHPVVEGYGKRDERLSGFMAMEGRDFAKSRKLMVVGRAVNSWGDGQTVSELKDRSTWDEFTDSIHQFDGHCKMAWVAESEGNQDGYNTNNSAFWRVIKRVLRKLDVWGDKSESDWSSRLVWSNLYKISPHAGGNPSDALCALQEPGCMGQSGTATKSRPFGA